MSSSPQPGSPQAVSSPAAPRPLFAEEAGPGRPARDEDVAQAFLYPEVSRSATPASMSGEAGLEGKEESLRAAVVQEGEARARVWYSGEIQREREVLRRALEGFSVQRETYFQDVEREAVRLTLLIARKVLEREARVDPLAVAAMVHVALQPLQAGTAVTLRVHPAAAQDWRLHFAARDPAAPAGVQPVIVEDGSLEPGDCVIETAMGKAEVSLGQKLGEIETSFLDLLAHRPRVSP